MSGKLLFVTIPLDEFKLQLTRTEHGDIWSLVNQEGKPLETYQVYADHIVSLDERPEHSIKVKAALDKYYQQNS